ncbi:energy transducer TonB [Leptolyngbya sp. PCC 6406]|uniref:energy transducer TonB n=1 Tax=Leptolyngbya sp. PCC 6406 TaxID=1173264 RepID=UPI0002ACEB99|nr:energy transducer TonB [Leptolyngbya sp. PCC 6406]
MSLSTLCFEQHEQDQARLQKLLVWGLLGSVGVHAIAFGLSHLNLRPNTEEAELALIELIVTEPLAPAPTQPADLSTETHDPAPAPATRAPATQAPAPKAAVVTAPQPVEVAKSEVAEAVEPELAETEAESDLEVPEEVPEEQEEETAESALPPEAVETEAEIAEAEEEPTAPDLAAVPEDASQFDRLRDFFRRRRDADRGAVATETPSAGSPESSGPPSLDATGTTETTAARPGTGTSETANPSEGGNGQGQGSRTVACQNCVRPNYPQSALDAGVEGQPMVSVDINPDGSVRSVTLTRSSGNPDIDQAALQAARNSRFQPVSGGARVPIEYDLTIEGSRRNRDARRRGERQTVELPPEPTPTPESAATAPSQAPTAPPVPSRENVEANPPTPAQPAASDLDSESEPAAEQAAPVTEPEAATQQPPPAAQPEPATQPPPPAAQPEPESDDNSES